MNGPLVIGYIGIWPQSYRFASQCATNYSIWASLAHLVGKEERIYI